MNKTAVITCQSCGAGVVMTGRSGACEYCGNIVHLPAEQESDVSKASIPVKPAISKGRLVLKGRGIKSLEQIISLYSDNELEEVTDLDLSDNLLEGLDGINRFGSVRELCLNNNRLTRMDKLPGSVWRLSVKGNLLGGFMSFGELDNVVDLDIRDNGYESLPDLPLRLIRLDASNNSISHIESLAQYTSLESITLNYNRITDVPELPVRPMSLMVYLEHNSFEWLDDVSVNNISNCQFGKMLFISLKDNRFQDYSQILRISLQTVDQIREQRNKAGESAHLTYYQNRFLHIHLDRCEENLSADLFNQELAVAEDGLHLIIYPDRSEPVAEVESTRPKGSHMVSTVILAFIFTGYIGYHFFSRQMAKPDGFGWVRLILTSMVLFSAGWIGVYLSNLMFRPNGVLKSISFIFKSIPAVICTAFVGALTSVVLALVVFFLMFLLPEDIFNWLSVGYAAILVVIGTITTVISAETINV